MLQVKTNLFHLPQLALQEIFNYLSLRDVMSVRQTCKPTLRSVNQYQHLKKRLRQVVITFNCKETLLNFVRSVSSLPFSQFAFKYDDLHGLHDMTQRTAMSLFIRDFGKTVETLYISNWNCCIEEKEYEFYQSLVNLKKLRVNEISTFSPLQREITTDCIQDKNFSQLLAQRKIPENITKSLEEFGFETCHKAYYVFHFLKKCSNLKTLIVGLSYSMCKKSCCSIRADQECFKCVVKLCEYIKHRQQVYSNRPDPDNLKVYYTSSVSRKYREATEPIYYDCPDGSAVCYPFLKGKSVRIITQNNHIFELVSNTSDSNNTIVRSKMVNNVQRIYKLTTILNDFNVPDVEGIFIKLKPGSIPPFSFNPKLSTPEWPSLKKIHVFSSKITCSKELKSTAVLIDYLFFELKKCDNVTEVVLVSPSYLVTPESVSVNFPNLNLFHIDCSLMESRHYTRMFYLLGRLTKIKQLSIRFSQPVFHDETFIGKKCLIYTGVPAFRTMKFLEHVNFQIAPEMEACVSKTLIQGEEIADTVGCSITDSFFTKVISKMTLKSFQIKGLELPAVRNLFTNGVGVLVHCLSMVSFWPKVTETGLESLIKGKFGRTFTRLLVTIPRYSRFPRDSRKIQAALKRLAELPSERVNGKT